MTLIKLFLLIVSLSISTAQHNNTTLISEQNVNTCDIVEDQVALVQKIDFLNAAIENIKHKLDTFNLKIDRIFGKLKANVNEINGHETPTAAKTNEIYNYEHLIDVRWDSETPNYTTTTTTPNAPEKLEKSSNIPSSCAQRQTGLHVIEIPNSNIDAFYIQCIEDRLSDGAAWMLIQRRTEGKIDFYRDWNHFQKGFGNLESEFFIGLDKLHAMTQHRPHELWIQLKDFSNENRWVKYSWFVIGNESECFALTTLGNYSGTAGDSLTAHLGQKFTTKDVDNDLDDDQNCAQLSTGAWWYGNCLYSSNLNGRYYGESFASLKISKGIEWFSWHGYYSSLKYAHMAIRPVK